MPGFPRHARRSPSRPSPARRGDHAPRPAGPLAVAEPLEPRLCLTTWYVAPTGSDIAFGTIDEPFASLSAAAAHARAGDTVLVRGGTYTPNSTQDLNCVGAADGRITVESYPGERPVLDGGGMLAGAPVVRISGQYLDFSGLEVRDAKGVGVVVTGQHLQVLNNTIDKSQQQGILVGSGDSPGGNPDGATDITVQNNSIFNSNLAPQPAPGSSGSSGSSTSASGPRPAAAEIYGASAVRFNGNYVHDNNGPGIEVVLSILVSVNANVVHDNTVANIALDNANHINLQQNFLYNTSETAYYTNGAPAASVLLSNGSYGLSNPLDYVLIANNIALSSGGNIVYRNVRPASDPDPGLKDSIIANNDFYSGGGANSANLRIDLVPGHSNNLVVDNIFYQVDGAQVLFRTASAALANGVTPDGFTFEYNNWFSGGTSALTHGGAPAAAGPGDVYSDPFFPGPGTIDPAGYKISTDSPDYDAGIEVSGVNADFYGIPRPQNKAPDIGAHEVVTTPPPPTPVQPPPGVPPGVPTGLAATSPSPFEIDLTWGDYTAPLAGFDIQRRGNGDWIPLGYSGAGPGNANYSATGSFADTGLKPNHKYTYRVFAFFTDSTVSDYSKTFTFKTPKKPKAVRPPKPVKAPKTPRVPKPKAAKPPKAAKAMEAAKAKDR